MPRRVHLVQTGLLDYTVAWDLQRRLVSARDLEQSPDILLLTEHPPVFTIGRSGQSSHWGGDEQKLNAAGYSVHRVERGGSVTYHGPGQLIGYPVLRLTDFCRGPKAYMHRLEEVLIRTLADFGIAGERIPRLTGVWVGSEKIAAMGVRIMRGITMHGFALNVTNDLGPFSLIVPCGIPDCRVTSMRQLLGRGVDQERVSTALVARFAEVFDVNCSNSASLSELIPTMPNQFVHGGMA